MLKAVPLGPKQIHKRLTKNVYKVFHCFIFIDEIHTFTANFIYLLRVVKLGVKSHLPVIVNFLEAS